MSIVTIFVEQESICQIWSISRALLPDVEITKAKEVSESCMNHDLSDVLSSLSCPISQRKYYYLSSFLSLNRSHFSSQFDVFMLLVGWKFLMLYFIVF